MKAKTTLHFYAKSTKANATGLFPIYVRLTVEGKRFEYSTKKFIEPSKWSNELSRMRGNSEEARSINSLLDFTKNQINEIQFELLKDNITLNIEEFKNRLLGTKVRERMLIPIFKEHNSKIKELLGIEYAPGTLERYETSLKHTSNFLFWKYNITDINIDKIDHAFITDYEFYLRTVRKCANNTAVKYIKNFNKIIKLCLANDWLDKNPFANYKSKVKEVERVYLSEVEIQNIINKDFKTERLSLVRDIFLFSCFTGLAYIDVKNLTKSHISIGIDGEKWIFTHRQKTETASKIPVLPVTQMIINKYADQIYQSKFPDHKNYGDITTINASELPDFDLLVGGFPCQSFSIAGKRKGFEDTRGTLFFDLARILQAKQPKLFIFENVKGLLSHDNGQTFKTIITTLVELGYDCQWQVLNSKNYGVPQNRERVFIVGHLGGFGGRQVFPIGKNAGIFIETNKTKKTQPQTKIATTVRPNMGTKADDTYIVQVADYRYDEGLRIRKKFISPCLTSTHKENGFSAKPLIINSFIQAIKYGQNNSDRNGNVSDDMFTLKAGGSNAGITDGIKIRRLTPTECERLQGFPDGWTDVRTNTPDSPRYKAIGNSMAVPCMRWLGKRIQRVI